MAHPAARWILAFSLATATAIALPAAAANLGFRPFEITTEPIANFAIGSEATRFGSLEFLGGLDLISNDPQFGSLSGLDFSPDGATLYAVGDRGTWISLKLAEKDGVPVGITEARKAPILDATGEPLLGKRTSDAEGLRIIVDKGRETAFVSFEQDTKVRRYVADPEFAGPKATVVKLPAFVKGIRRNSGFEAIALAPADGPLQGAIVLIAEASLDKAGNHSGFIVGGPRPGPFSLKKIGPYDVTDAAFLPDGDLLVLERKFSLADGLGMRIRRISGDTLKPGAEVDGAVLIEADLRNQIDNMEGLAIRDDDDRGTLIALVSDDNQALLQRTILLFFRLPPDGGPGASSG